MSARFVTDGGLETDLIFNRGIDLPGFAAFPLLDSEAGRDVLRDYYLDYVDIAARAGVGVVLESPTWCASPDRAPEGYDAGQLDRINGEAVEFLRRLGQEYAGDVRAWLVSGNVGPRGNAYEQGAIVDPDEAADYHRPQIAAFRAAGADRVTALTLTSLGEAIGIARVTADLGIDALIGFTVETDGRLPDGTTLDAAVAAVDADTPPASFVINCAHPTHIATGLSDGVWRERIGGLRVNASTMSHAELDEAEELDAGDPSRLAADQRPLLDAFPRLEMLGGCCGTDARHVAAMWGV